MPAEDEGSDAASEPAEPAEEPTVAVEEPAVSDEEPVAVDGAPVVSDDAEVDDPAVAEGAEVDGAAAADAPAGGDVDADLRLRAGEAEELRALQMAPPSALPRTSSRGRHLTTPAEWVGLALITVVGLGIVLRSPPSPTGVGVIDVVETAALVGLMVAAGSRARRWALIVGAACVAGAGTGLGLVAGLTALGVTAALVVTGRRSRILGGAVGGLIALGALHLPTEGIGAASALLAFAAFVPVLASGYRNTPSHPRRQIRFAALVVVGAIVAMGAALVFSSASARRGVASAVEETEAGMVAISEGDEAGAEDRFAIAAEEFRAAEVALGKPWILPIQAVPVLSQNYRAMREATGVGSRVTGVLSENVGALRYEDLNRPDGGLDVDVLIGFRRPVAAVDREMRAALRDLEGVESPWLLGPVSSRLEETQRRFTSYQDETELAKLATTDGPRLLGATEPRRYLFLLGNPAEARDLGGHLGNWAEVTVDRGRLDLVKVGGPGDLALDPADQDADSLDPYPSSLVEMDPYRFPQNWGADPDLATVARLSAQLFEERTGRSIDGVAYADPDAFAAFLDITGPVLVPEAVPPTQVSAANAVKFLTSDQFVRFPTERAGDAAVEELVRTVFDELTETQLPDPRRLGDDFGPIVDEGRFAFYSLHEQDAALLDRLQVTRALPDARGANLLGVINRNANPSKIDTYLQRQTDATFDWDPETGEVTGTVEVTLTNVAPPGGLNTIVLGNELGRPLGTNVTDLTILSRFELVDATIGGKAVPARSDEVERSWRHTLRLEVPPGGSVVAVFRLRGATTPGPRHRLEIVGQPLVNEGSVRVTIIPADGTIRSTGAAMGSSRDGQVQVETPDTSYRTFDLRLED
ncbi:DUF4012 domain-containing protein [Aquihabitans daechungensis]|uniref:DUF4012 domain-containing protein n=1 Tax=Aquihabitans daechungensis TaxID=1052257 RepID=UPI003BA01153